MQGARTVVIVEGIQRCFCMDKGLKGIPPKLTQHKIELHTIIPSTR
jgi:hypothetical protein